MKDNVKIFVPVLSRHKGEDNRIVIVLGEKSITMINEYKIIGTEAWKEDFEANDRGSLRFDIGAAPEIIKAIEKLLKLNVMQ